MTGQIDDQQQAKIVLDVIRRRRVRRAFRDESVPVETLLQVVEAGRWASSASNRRIHRFLVVREAQRIRLTRMLSPGMLTEPPALIVICTDLDKAEAEGVQVERDATTSLDVGTAAMNMMIAAEALGLGTCPVTSFSPAGVRAVLDLPDHIYPDMLLMVGHPKAGSESPRHRESLPVAKITDWEHIGGELAET